MPKPRSKQKKTRSGQNIFTRLQQHLKFGHSEPERRKYLQRVQEARVDLTKIKQPSQKEVFKNRLRKARAQLPKKKAA